MKVTSLVILLLLSFLTTQPVVADSAVLNEIMPHPSPGSDWLEIYNPTSDNINLTNWTLVDNTSTIKTLSGTITTNAFITFDVTNRLNNSGDSIYLKDPNGNIIDSYSYSSDPGINKSFGRNPDGGSWTALVNSSKGSNNGKRSLPTSSPIPSPTPTPSLAPAASSTPSPTPKPSSLFTLSNIPSQINSDQSFDASINLVLPNNHNTVYYLSGAFKKADGTRYFGLTKNNSNWIEYDSSNYLNQYKITTDNSGNWTGVLEVKPDIKDSDYKGSGEYIFKVARYTSSGSNPVWSNEYTIKINDANSSSDTSPVSELPSKVSSSDSPSPTNLQSNTPKISQSPKLTYRLASVAAATTYTQSASPEAKVEVKNQKLNNPFFWIGFIFIFAGISLIGYIYLRKNARNHI